MEILHFIFQDFNHFLGTIILVGIIFEGIVEIIKALK
jgi:hypothetical protein